MTYRLLVYVYIVLALFGAWGTTFAQERPTVIVFSRHTFRGVSSDAKPVEVKLGESLLALPLLGYTRDATINGLKIAKTYGAPAINQAAERVAQNMNSSFDSVWDEIRVDMSVGRDFFTGLYFREGLQPFQDKPILLTGCPTKRSVQVDAVLGCDLLRACIPKEEMSKLQAESVGAKRLQQVGEALVNAVCEGLSLPPVRLPQLIDESGKINPFFRELVSLASSIEMVSEQGPPLATLFPKANKERLAGIDPEIVSLASGYLGIAFSAVLPLKAAYATAVLPLQYVKANEGRHVILATHDDVISVLLRSLHLSSEDGPVENLMTMPMESIVIAFDSRFACVGRVRLKIARDGSMPGSFSTKILWQGTRSQWEAKVARVMQEAASWPVGAKERAELKLLDAPVLDVIYRVSDT